MTLTLGHIGKATGRDATSSIHTSHIIIYLPPNDISKPWLSHFIGKLNDLVTYCELSQSCSGWFNTAEWNKNNTHIQVKEGLLLHWISGTFLSLTCHKL